MNIRQATMTDADSIARLCAESWRIAYHRILPGEFLDRHMMQDRQAVWRQRFTAPKDMQLVLVAEESQELCGFVYAYGQEDPQWGSYIDNLHVRRESQRRGIGKPLMIEIAHRSRRHYPGAGFYLSEEFYERFGFRKMTTAMAITPSEEDARKRGLIE
ncbi:MAG: GNAT family N-acetyltransferase [Acidiferrobacterales bacterium]